MTERDERPEEKAMDPAQHDLHGAGPGVWVRLGPTDWWAVLLSVGPLWLLGYLAFQAASLVARVVEADVVVRIVAGGAAVAVAVGLTLWIVRARVPDVSVDIASGRLRAGRREIGWDELTEAQLLIDVGFTPARRSLTLLLRAPGGLRIPLVLKRRGRTLMKGRDAALARRVIEGSSIAQPRASEDPDGKFSRWNFPTHVSKSDALSLVDSPPTPDQPLPIPQ